MTPLRCNLLSFIDLRIRVAESSDTETGNVRNAYRNFERSVFERSAASVRRIELRSCEFERKLEWPPYGLDEQGFPALESLSIEDLWVDPAHFAEQLYSSTRLSRLYVEHAERHAYVDPADWAILLQALSSEWPMNPVNLQVSSAGVSNPGFKMHLTNRQGRHP